MIKRIIALILMCGWAQAADVVLGNLQDGFTFTSVDANNVIIGFGGGAVVDNLILEYLFGANGDEANITLDTSGNSYTGTVSGATWSPYTNGVIHNYDFDAASSDHIDASTAISEVSALQDGSVSFWFKTDSSSTMFLFSGSDSGDLSSQCGWPMLSGQFGPYIRDNGTYSLQALTPLTYNDGNWHHYIYTTESGTNRNYVDGQPITMTYSVGNASANVFFADVTGLDWLGVAANKDLDHGIELEFDGKMWGPTVSEEVFTDATAYATNRAQALTLGISSKEASDLDLDPVLDVTFSDDTTQDGSTNYFALTDTSTTHVDLGYTNAARGFNGSTSGIDAGDNDKFSFTEGTNDLAFSVSAWVKLDTMANEPMISKWNVGSTREWNFTIVNSDVTFHIFDETLNKQQGRLCNADPLSSDIWYHVAGVYDPSIAIGDDGMKVYINGVRCDDTDNSNAGYAYMRNTTAPVRIGGHSTITLDGNLDEPQVYNTALSATQVTNLFLAQETKFGQLAGIRDESWFGNLKALYTFNTANSGKSQDYSGNGNHGTDTSVTKSISEGSAEFNGSTSQIILPSILIENNSTNYTIATWAYIEDSSSARHNDRIYNQIDGAGNHQIDLMQGNRTASGSALQWSLSVYEGGYTDLTATNELNEDAWNHLAVTVSGTFASMYHDGILVKTGSTATVNSMTAAAWGSFAAVSGANKFLGKLDNSAVYDTALTSNQVYNLYNDYPHSGQ